MLDCFKKVRESQNKPRRAIAQEDLAAEAGGEGADVISQTRAKGLKYEDGRAAIIYISDPAEAAHRDPTSGNWNWNVPGMKKMAVISAVTKPARELPSAPNAISHSIDILCWTIQLL